MRQQEEAMTGEENCITLIGMPASGKSCIGVVLAKVLSKDFVDTDLVIQRREKKTLADLIEERGLDGFLAAEEAAILATAQAAGDTVIATGGSAVYSERAMQELRKKGTVVYLMVAPEESEKRLGDMKARGVVAKHAATPAEVFAERKPLYERYADLTVDEEGLSLEETVAEIVKKLGRA